MYLNPDRMTIAERVAVDAWLQRNGCRHHIAIEPIIIKGQWAHYTAMCHRDPKSLRRAVIRKDELVSLGPRRVRIRTRWADTQ
jgi:hypothetical protein